MIKPTTLSAEEIVELKAHFSHFDKERRTWCRLCDPNHGYFMQRMLATIDARATEIAALKGVLESIVSAIDAHHPKYKNGPYTFTQTEIDRLRRVLAGKEAQG